MGDSERVIVIFLIIAAFLYFIGIRFLLKPAKPRNFLFKSMDFIYKSEHEKKEGQ
jgi:hypothetical protein